MRIFLQARKEGRDLVLYSGETDHLTVGTSIAFYSIGKVF